MIHLLLAIVFTASLDSTYIPIGGQVGLNMVAEMNEGEPVDFPTYGEQLIPGVEIVRLSPVDSVFDKQGHVTYRRTLTLTSFTDSLFYLPPVYVTSGTDTFFSEPQALNVIQPFVLDSTFAITDIKTIHQPRIWWWGIIRPIWGLALLVLIIVLVIWLIARIGRYTGKYTAPLIQEPARPAEEVALEQLNRIKQEKVWQTGETKRYHTELTDVLRTYIAGRFGVASTEKTSDETLRELKPIMNEQRELHRKLSDVLRLADLVKFAKWNTTPEENEQALRTAYEFVEQTTPETVQEKNEKKENKQ